MWPLASLTSLLSLWRHCNVVVSDVPGPLRHRNALSRRDLLLTFEQYWNRWRSEDSSVTASQSLRSGSNSVSTGACGGLQANRRSKTMEWWSNLSCCLLTKAWKSEAEWQGWRFTVLCTSWLKVTATYVHFQQIRRFIVPKVFLKTLKERMWSGRKKPAKQRTEFISCEETEMSAAWSMDPAPPRWSS